jgi:hypothetical protein
MGYGDICLLDFGLRNDRKETYPIVKIMKRSNKHNLSSSNIHSLLYSKVVKSATAGYQLR